MRTFSTLLLSLIVSGSAFAAEMDANKIMETAHINSYYQGNDGKAQVIMKVFQKDSKTPLKKMFYIMRLDAQDGGEQKMLTYFMSPSDIQRTTFLVHKKINEDDFRRLYIPASDKILAIAGSRKQDPFMGSDFSYEDVSGRHFNKDNHKLLGEEKYEGQDVYVVESTPKIKEDKISKMKSWITKSDLIPMQVEFYNHDNKVFKKYHAENIQTIQTFKTVLKQVMESPLDGTYTEILFNPKNLQYNIGLKEDNFTERSLKNPPLELMK